MKRSVIASALLVVGCASASGIDQSRDGQVDLSMDPLRDGGLAVREDDAAVLGGETMDAAAEYRLVVPVPPTETRLDGGASIAGDSGPVAVADSGDMPPDTCFAGDEGVAGPDACATEVTDCEVYQLADESWCRFLPVNPCAPYVWVTDPAQCDPDEGCYVFDEGVWCSPPG